MGSEMCIRDRPGVEEVYSAEVELGPSSLRDGGNGVFAAKDINANTKVAWYFGREIHPRTAQLNRLQNTHLHNYTVLRGMNGRVIQGKPDAYISKERFLEDGGWASFVNMHPSFRREGKYLRVSL